MVDKSRMTLQKLARWHPSQSNTVQDRKGSAALWEGTLQPLDHEDLKQGALYIIKIHHVSVGLFQGWNDDMCCFAVLRSDNIPMRWSQARYLPGDFDAYDAFDEAGNPPVHLWTRYLRVEVPINWFSIFEEARRKQREWTTHVLGHQHHHHHHIPPTTLHDPPMTTSTAPITGMMEGGDGTGGFPSVTTMHQQQQQQQQRHVNEDYSDHGTFSAAPSQSIRSERLSSISSLPLESRPEVMVPPIATTAASTTVTAANSPPQSPTPSITSHNPQATLTEETQSSLNRANINSVQPATIAPNDELDKNKNNNNVTNQSQQNAAPKIIASSTSIVSSPTTITTTTQVPTLPITSTTPIKTTKRRSTVGATPSQQLELALGDLSFPHDDDRFSIHSDYQSNHSNNRLADPYVTPAAGAPSSSSSSSLAQHYPDTNHTWKKRSIKRMLRRSSNGTK